MTQAFFVPGPLPSLNEAIDVAKGYGGRGFGYAKLKQRWTNAVALYARAARIKPVGRARFQFVWRERTKRRNPDNVASAKKYLLDGLVRAKIIKNDGWDEVAGWEDRWEIADKPGVLVVIDQMGL